MRFLTIFTLFLSLNAFAGQVKSERVWVTVGSDAVEKMNKHMKSNTTHSSYDGITVMEIDLKETDHLSHMMHEEFHRCGGFMVHDSLEEALEHAHASDKRSLANLAA